ncbi:MAG: cell envelope integrity protein TolA [Lachnospiraceae bacterium]|nr:cell envelope integrity protein TolA [Lachnospiraceae bacterium]
MSFLDKFHNNETEETLTEPENSEIANPLDQVPSAPDDQETQTISRDESQEEAPSIIEDGVDDVNNVIEDAPTQTSDNPEASESQSDEESAAVPTAEPPQLTPKQRRAAEKASKKELKRREKEIALAEKKVAREKAALNAEAARQKEKAEKHRLEEEEEALKLITSLTTDAEHFDPESIGMSPELYKRAMELKKRKAKEERDRRVAEYKKNKMRGEDSRFTKAAKDKANKARFLNFINLPYKLKVECEKDYPTYKLALHLLIAFTIITFVCHFVFSLSLACILICCLVYFFGAPSIIYYRERKRFESNRFRDCSRYIEQMIFSFTRRHKLLTALEETRLVLDGTIGDAIDYAIDIIRNRVGEEDIYSVALRKIEMFFPSARVRNLHEFLIAVERDGGRHETTMKILLDDVREWDIRTNQFKQNQSVKGMSLLISILMSVGVCWFMTNILPPELGGDISSNPIYQIVTTLMLIVMFLMYLFGNRKLTRSWITDNLHSDEEKIATDLQAISTYFDEPKGKIKPVLAIIRMQTEIEKTFPRWVLRLALLCSSYPVTVALAKSVSSAPVAIKADLENMVESINKNPTSIEPYLEFGRHYDLPQVRSIMMMIYSLSEYGLNDADQQILSLVKRNNALQANAEQIENDEQLARFSLFTIIPMIFASLVMMVDVILIVLNMVSNIL